MRHLNVNTKHRKQRVLRVRFHVFRSLTIFHGFFLTIASNAPRGVLAVLNLGLACMIEWIFLKELVPTIDDGWPSFHLVIRWQKGFFVHLTISKPTSRKPTPGSCRCEDHGNVPLDYYTICFVKFTLSLMSWRCRSVACYWNRRAYFVRAHAHVLLCWGKEILWTRPSSTIMVIREYLALRKLDKMVICHKLIASAT
jgi:hypothetical protein